MRISDLSGTGFPGGVILVLGVIWALLALLVQMAFAIAIYQDAERNLRPQGKLVFVNPFTWALAAMFFSVAGAALYWLIHHSSLRAAGEGSRA